MPMRLSREGDDRSLSWRLRGLPRRETYLSFCVSDLIHGIRTRDKMKTGCGCVHGKVTRHAEVELSEKHGNCIWGLGTECRTRTLAVAW
jgi:hypothetical protein